MKHKYPIPNQATFNLVKGRKNTQIYAISASEFHALYFDRIQIHKKAMIQGLPASSLFHCQIKALANHSFYIRIRDRTIQ